MSCPCDETVWPPPLDIPAGLSDLPRQQFVFAELRKAMLDRAKYQPALSEWRARSKDDYGVLWLELWAYVGELLSLYDKAIADESYVRTAKLRPSLRRLLESLGYVPAPAVAATVELAVLADGARPVELPVGTGFRSAAFDAEPPQVFELTSAVGIHPALNRWPVITPVATVLTGSIDALLLAPQTAAVNVDDTVLVELSSASADAHVRKVTAVERILDDANRRVVKVTLDRAVEAGAGKPVAGVRIRKAGRTAELKTPTLGEDGDAFAIFTWLAGSGGGGPLGLALFKKIWAFILDGHYRSLHTGERFLVTVDDETRWATAYSVFTTDMTLVPGSTSPAMTIDIEGTDDDVVVPERAIPPVTATHTAIWSTGGLDEASRKASSTSPNWAGLPAEAFRIHFELRGAGKVLGPVVPTVLATDPLAVRGARPPVGSTASTARLILRDAEARGVAVDGTVDLAGGALTVAAGVTWTPGLAAPLEAFGNIVTAVRGETVAREVLGSGDATVEHQHFQLAKKPLTYVPSAGAKNAAGVASTLRVWVDGVQWSEVASFYGQPPDARVFIVRQDDDGASTVTFGDGVRGARLTTGVGNVVASYRFGAGAASPPAGSIMQIARPVAGLASVVGAVAAGGGADAEPAESIRELAPRSALLLGRAISIDDFEVAARGTPGVIAARADWTWEHVAQRPVVRVWVVGGENVENTVHARLAGISDPGTPIACGAATAVAATLAIDLEIDPTRIAADVRARVEDALLGERGVLRPAQLGIDRPLLRSPLLALLLGIEGVVGVLGLTWNGTPFTGYGVEPGVGAYFDLAAGTTVTGG